MVFANADGQHQHGHKIQQFYQQPQQHHQPQQLQQWRAFRVPRQPQFRTSLRRGGITMFRWLRERKQKKAAERRAQLRDKVQTGGLAGARKQLSYYADGKATPQPETSDSVAQGFTMQLIAQQMARDLSDSGPRHHVTQVHHGSGDNIGGSTSHGHHGHSSHDYSGSHHSSHDSGSYDSGSSSSGSDSSW